MAFIEGADFSSYKPVIVAYSYTKPTSGRGATVGSHDVPAKGQANVNSGVSPGLMIQLYRPELAILFGTDDF